ncbi:hypothetical protein [Nocardia sp. NPDC019255]
MTRDERYEAAKREWIAEQLKNCPPLNDRQKQLIRTAFAAHRREQGEAA